MNGWSLYILMVISTFLYADEKIYHMIYAKKQPAPFNKNEQEGDPRGLLYCIKTDNNLYATDVTDSKKEEKEYNHHYELRKIQLYTPKKQAARNITQIIDDGFSQGLESYDLEPVEGRLMMIGQPIMDENNNWIMPAVVKRKYFGFLQSTDLCVVLQKTVKNYGPDDESFQEMQDDTLEYIVYRIADGHRTLANFVDIVKTGNNNLTLRSSSKWPTIKTVDLDNPKNSPPKKDAYFLDSYQQGNFYFDLEAKVSKSFFNKKQVVLLTCNVHKKSTKPNQTITVDVKNAYFNFLTKISLNPDFVYNSDVSDIQNTLNKFLSDKKLQNPDNRYKLYILNKDAVLFVPINQNYLPIGLLVGEDKEDLVDSISNHLHFTSSTYDFTNNRLFYAEYSQKSKDVFVRFKTITLKEKSFIENIILGYKVA